MTDAIEVIYDRNVADEKLKNGTKYERLAALVFKHLDERGVVLHDLRLRGDGKETAHQIDVTIDIAGASRRIVVECRDKEPDNKIGLGEVRDFNGVLVQLQAGGIMLTTEGYTRGAITYAADEGISLAILREFRDDQDWQGKLQAIVLHITALIPDERSITVRLVTRDPNADTSLVVGVDPNEVLLTSETGEVRGTLADRVREALASPAAQQVGHVEAELRFEESLLVSVPGHASLSLTGLVVGADVQRVEEELRIDAGDRVAELLLETLGGDTSRVIFDADLQRYEFTEDGTVVPRGQRG